MDLRLDTLTSHFDINDAPDDFGLGWGDWVNEDDRRLINASRLDRAGRLEDLAMYELGVLVAGGQLDDIELPLPPTPAADRLSLFRVAIEPLILFRDAHLDLSFVDEDKDPMLFDAALAMDRAFDAIDAAMRALESPDDYEKGAS